MMKGKQNLVNTYAPLRVRKSSADPDRMSRTSHAEEDQLAMGPKLTHARSDTNTREHKVLDNIARTSSISFRDPSVKPNLHTTTVRTEKAGDTAITAAAADAAVREGHRENVRASRGFSENLDRSVRTDYKGGAKKKLFVGRITERVMMCKSIERFVGSGESQVMVVEGESGIGKTTLVNEVFSSIKNAGYAARFLTVSSESIESHTPYAVLRSLMRQLLEVHKMNGYRVEDERRSSFSAVRGGRWIPSNDKASAQIMHTSSLFRSAAETVGGMGGKEAEEVANANANADARTMANAAGAMTDTVWVAELRCKLAKILSSHSDASAANANIPRKGRDAMASVKEADASQFVYEKSVRAFGDQKNPSTTSVLYGSSASSNVAEQPALRRQQPYSILVPRRTSPRACAQRPGRAANNRHHFGRTREKSQPFDVCARVRARSARNPKSFRVLL